VKWTRVRSDHFVLIGDAADRQIREVATRLEQFRASMIQALPNAQVSSPVPTVVIVFADDRSYKPFKPLYRGKIMEQVGGHVQRADDVNYIALTADGNDERFSTIFHEYTHLIVAGTVHSAPVWFNEGLAEYYSTFTPAANGKTAMLGRPIARHVLLLRERFLPIADLIAVDHGSPLYNEGEKASIFYAESWALLHYLLKEHPGGAAQLSAYLGLLESKITPTDAFQQAFGVQLPAIERALRAYVRRNVYNMSVVEFGERVSRSAPLTSEPLAEAEAEARLGDFLLHMNRLDEAESRLQAALKMDRDASDTYSSLGSLRLRQDRFDDAWTLLSRAAQLSPNSFATQYALGTSFFRGRTGVMKAADSTDGRMTAARNALARAVELDPAAPDAWVWLANAHMLNETPDDARRAIERAVRLAPRRQEYRLLAARIAVAQGDTAAARSFIGDLAARADREDLVLQARDVLALIARSENYAKQRDALGVRPEAERPPPASMPAEIPAFRPVGAGELRALGVIERIDCRPTAGLVLHAKLPDRTLHLAAKSFEEVTLVTFRPDVKAVACGAQERYPVFITWRPVVREATVASNGVDGIAVAVEILPEGYVPR
jgi:tetratricopeptide (TPR) repeat protein